MITKDLSDWLIKNRDSEGLGELFLELSRRMKEHREVIMLLARKGEIALKEVGAHDEIDSLVKMLMQPLQQTDTSLET